MQTGRYLILMLIFCCGACVTAPTESALYKAGQAYERAQYSQSLRQSKKFIRRNPNSADAFYVKALALIKESKFDAALIALDQALDLKPFVAAYLLERGRVHGILGHTELAQKDIDKALEIEPHNAQLHFLKGNQLALEKNYELALLSFTKSIRLDATQWTCFAERGKTRVQLEDLLGAQADFTKAIELAPQRFEGFELRGQVRYQLKKYPQAIEDFNLSLALKPQSALAYYYRAISYFQSGDTTLGCIDLKQARKLHHPIDPAFYAGFCN